MATSLSALSPLVSLRADTGDQEQHIVVLAQGVEPIGFAWVASAIRQAFGPAQPAWLNQSLDPVNRAILFSVDRQADALGQIVGGPIIGLVASATSIRAALASSAALLGLAVSLFSRQGSGLRRLVGTSL